MAVSEGIKNALSAFEDVLATASAVSTAIEDLGGDDAPAWVHLHATEFRRIDAAAQTLIHAIRARSAP